MPLKYIHIGVYQQFILFHFSVALALYGWYTICLSIIEGQGGQGAHFPPHQQCMRAHWVWELYTGGSNFWPILCLIVEFWVLFHIWIQVLCQICNLQIFSSYRVCHFILLAEQTFEILMKSDLPEIFNGSCFWCRICELSKGCEDFFCFLWIFWNFLVLCLNFSSFILLYLFLYSF